ncbi:hypothetical protein KHQ82_02870 [Mycoplasmatota bacterium]|nr:hypothetical protein KHQ82_02870 [Mycoplasmatota bacterium]
MKRVKEYIFSVVESNEKLLKLVWIYFLVITIIYLALFVLSFIARFSSWDSLLGHQLAHSILAFLSAWIKHMLTIIGVYLLISIRINLKNKD